MMQSWSYGFSYNIGPVGFLIMAALVVLPFWRIFTKAGYPGLMALLVFVPGVNLILLYWFAFADWPVERRS